MGHSDYSIVPGPRVSLSAWCLGAVTTLDSGWLMGLSARCCCGGQIAGLKVGGLTVLRCWQQTLTAGQIHEPVVSKRQCAEMSEQINSKWQIRAGQKIGQKAQTDNCFLGGWYNFWPIFQTGGPPGADILVFNHNGMVVGMEMSTTLMHAEISTSIHVSRGDPLIFYFSAKSFHLSCEIFQHLLYILSTISDWNKMLCRHSQFHFSFLFTSIDVSIYSKKCC